MGLQQQLDEQKKTTSNKASPETIQTMGQATADLKASGIENRALGRGDQVPDFCLPNAQGNEVSLANALSHGPVVLSIYRGGWCPYCNLEIRALKAVLPEIEALGASLIAIAPEMPEKTYEMGERHTPGFEILSDVGNRVSRQFGLVFSLPETIRTIYAGFGIDLPACNGDASFELPLPATYVVRTDGQIAYGFVNADYTKRMEPAEIIQALKSL
ncbi:peroxiredoxin-like family protein [Sedimenticola selenatireducens]|uniref:thioredoxin-dependent peroxiredoxin n=1 Tax=Sedimenticola selenatireducens TaxID=191960 RepID=A0A558DZH7_9GAMM|nr:peroxiredoxin-like family protein [Sedimenticola selenatireducens]TVO71950.1 AhpC/TSA family protein [Sedimenticola selenatireducens]TVT66330.1 MAG: AhpC/TSA family protein [Sedimenticola selenatireducens]